MENENNFDNNQIDIKNISSSVINEKEIKKFNSVNINTNYFENSKNYISKELFFSYNQQNNLLLS